MLKTIVLVLTFATIGLCSGAEAQAQFLFRKGAARQDMVVTAIPPGSPMVTAAPATRVYTYSYYTRSTLPARTYVGYGDNDFPYYGAPYGHPYDPWTWPAMSGSYQAGMARYYSPPLP